MADRTYFARRIEEFYEVDSLPPVPKKQKLRRSHYKSIHQKTKEINRKRRHATLAEKIAEYETRSKPSFRYKSQKKRKSKQDIFLSSPEWKEVRRKSIEKYGTTCLCCGVLASPPHVDHVKPKSKYPELALDINNLQILCKKCNFDKNNKHETDYRHAA